MKTTIKYILWSWFFLLFFISCDRMNDLHDEYLQRGESSYLARIDEVKINSGKNRAELVFVNKDAKARTMTIYWRSRTDSLVYTIPENSVGKELKVPINDLPEDFLTFELITKTSDGKSKSLTSELSTRIYGDAYQTSLNNRLVDKAVYLESANELDISWKGVFEGAVNIGVEYEGTDGATKKVKLPIEQRSILYLNMYNGDLKYRTAYVPEESALDTFYSEYNDLPFSELYVIEGLTFNGTNQYLRIPNHADFNINSGEVLSISLWVKTPVGNTTQRLLMKRYTSLTADPVNGNTGYGIAPLSDRRMYADWYYRNNTNPNPGGGSNVLSANNYFPLDTWMHLTAIFNSSTKQIKLYQNGNLVGTSTLPAAVPANPAIVSVSDVFVGVWQDPYPSLQGYFKGEIAHLRFWKKALSAEEILADMITPVTAQTPDLVAGFDLRKIMGTGTNLTISDIKGKHTAVLSGYSKP
ncbi:DUF4998 domain-containing protein [Sphingobacterium faecale]|uniref:LamG-like jellyroll fold domain-containing protein n=1 Tax=Sphingobacterium faecale TaxID=2803775 RepID=A0ABS1R3Y1_9SPHI|nr:DUF4998 domain-containing protein [Sphingobacterium faecale]MBL1409408.1 hypothetical protein [Sphingobacterium faecale]